MKVVFLCGGIGRRMLPITKDKFLLKFLGKTLLEHQIELAVGAGLTDFVIIASARSIEGIERLLQGMHSIRLEVVPQQEPAGIADALKSASGLLDDEIIVANPNDVFAGSAYVGLLDARRANSAVSYVLGCEVTEYFPGGYLEFDPANRLTHIVEKPERGTQPSSMVNILVHLHTDPERLLRYVAATVSDGDDAYERALDTMAGAEHSIGVVPYSDTWTPIKYPWHVLAAVRRFLDASPGYIAPSASISNSAVIEGKVIIEDNVTILENAVVRGPVYIGPNAVIGNGSLIRSYSHIGSDCVVGFSTEIKGSYVGDGCWFHMSYVGDAVIGEGCSFGANTVFANWRFDEQTIRVRVGDEVIDSGLHKLGAIVGNGCRTGVNTSLMPGVKVGPNAIVGAQTCLMNDLPAGCMAVTSDGYRITRNRFQPEAPQREARMTWPRS